MVRILSKPPVDGAETLERVSAGGIIFSGGKVLLIRRRDQGTWIFPKGHVEEKETDKEAAVREVSEETGIRGVKPSSYIGSVEYSFFWPEHNKNYCKKVHYFLFVCKKMSRIHLEKYFDRFGWLKKSGAKQKLYFGHDKKILDLAFRAMHNETLKKRG